MPEQLWRVVPDFVQDEGIKIIPNKKKRKKGKMVASRERLEISSRNLEIPRTFHATVGTKKDKNGMDLTEVKVLRRGGKNTQKNYTKKIFMTQITTKV